MSSSTFPSFRLRSPLHAAWGEFPVQRAHEGFDRRLGGAVGADTWRGNAHHGGGQCDDRAAIGDIAGCFRQDVERADDFHLHEAAEIRRIELGELGKTTAEQVAASGEAVRLSPMNPFERKVVHDAVAEAGMTSDSDGVEPNRHVVIRPA